MTFTVAVVGGGQLARMLHEAASAIGVTLRPLVEESDGSAARVTPLFQIGAAKDLAALRRLSSEADCLTFEHEHVDLDQLRELAEEGVSVRPGPDALLYAQDKLAMRRRLTELGVPTPAWAEIRSRQDLERFGEATGWPIVVKTARGGYDGKGVRVVRAPADIHDWLIGIENGSIRVPGLGGSGGESLLAEEFIPFTRELAALVARRPGPSGDVRSWPVVETVQVDGVCSQVVAPAQGLARTTAERVRSIAENLACAFDVVGVLAVELLVVEDGSKERVFVNELAMRPHNSGHWTMEGATTSQFEQHLRAVLDLPLGDTSPRQGIAVMANVFGNGSGDPMSRLPRALERYPNAKVHLYGKVARPGRKLGHVTVCGQDVETVRAAANDAARLLMGD